MRISDWSSDVCSSDLPLYKTVELQCPRTNAFKRRQASHQYIVQAAIAMAGLDHVLIGRGFNDTQQGWVTLGVGTRGAHVFFCKTITPGTVEIGRASCRERVCKYV